MAPLYRHELYSARAKLEPTLQHNLVNERPPAKLGKSTFVDRHFRLQCRKIRSPQFVARAKLGSTTLQARAPCSTGTFVVRPL